MKITSIVRFIKIEHSIFSLPLIAAGAYIGSNHTTLCLRTFLYICLAAIGARTLGMAMNRIIDRHIDKRNQRTAKRELATGVLRLSHAYAIALCGLALYLGSCILLGPLILLLSPIPALALSIYSYLKRYTWLCHFGIGMVLGLGPLGAFVAVKQSIIPSPEILHLTAFTVLWMSGYDIIYSLQDLSFDRKEGLYSIPARFGPFLSQIIAGVCHGVSFVCLLFVASSGSFSWLSGTVLLIALFIFILSYIQKIPLTIRFFPLSAISGIAGALIVFL